MDIIDAKVNTNVEDRRQAVELKYLEDELIFLFDSPVSGRKNIYTQ